MSAATGAVRPAREHDLDRLAALFTRLAEHHAEAARHRSGGQGDALAGAGLGEAVEHHRAGGEDEDAAGTAVGGGEGGDERIDLGALVARRARQHEVDVVHGHRSERFDQQRQVLPALLAADRDDEAPAREVLRERRRRLVVDKAAQTRMIVSVAWPPALFLAISGVALGSLAVLMRSEAVAQGVQVPGLTPILVALLGFLVFAMGFICINALRVSFRVAGPTFRLKRVLEAATDGDYSVRARLRRGDYLHDLAETMNDLLAHLEERHAPQVESTETAPSESEVSA